MYTILKRLFDIVFSGLSIIILSPLFLIGFIGIKLSSEGPAIYKSKRVGKNGKLFVMYKFRSMYLNNDSQHIITLRTDNRIFPFGAFIRKVKIDELPQLINILKGDMTIIGWRPEAEEYANTVFSGKYAEIMKVKPGLSSPGSIYDYTHGEQFESEEEYNKIFLPQKLKLELYYVQNQSFIYDVEIIFRTVVVIFSTLVGKKDFAPPKELNYVGK